MPRYKALLAYDGTAYQGFQRQRRDRPTVQQALEDALTHISKRPISVTAAGRTDSGVHATGQVISFVIDWRHPVNALQNALNAALPADIAILQLEQAPDTFHPRFDARRRAYKYLIDNSPVRNPLHRLHSWHVRQPLDVARMNRAAAVLIGEHDFATFGQPPQGTNTVRELFAAHWEQDVQFLTFFIEANAFLYRMVRSLVGSLKLVGEGAWSVEQFKDAFNACDRSRSGKAAPPQGLYLVSVAYE